MYTFGAGSNLPHAPPVYNTLLPFGSIHDESRTDHSVWLIFTNLQAKQTASIFRLRLKIGHALLQGTAILSKNIPPSSLAYRPKS